MQTLSHRVLHFDAAGRLLEVQQELDWDELPGEVASAALERFAPGSILQIESITTPSSPSYFEFVVRNGTDTARVQLGLTGEPVSIHKPKS